MIDWKPICDPAVQTFIINNEHVDDRELVLRHKTLFDLPAKSIAEQIAGRRKSKKKIPLWFGTRGIVYPPALNLEQSSSQATALFKAQLLRVETKEESVVDLTGGFGVDSFFFSKEFKSVSYVEPNAELVGLVRHNHEQLGAMNIHHVCATAEAFIAAARPTGVFYLDPARRDVNAKKIFKLSDCAPDITLLQDTLFLRSAYVLLKASPWLDIQQGLRELPNTRLVVVLAVENEMKELLFLQQRDFAGVPTIRAMDLDSSGAIKSGFAFTAAQETAATVSFSEPLHYLYEPHAAILKAGAFKLVAQQVGVQKLAPNTHLYTSDSYLPAFPGRAFRVLAINPDEKQLREIVPTAQAHTAVRNYPLTAQQLMKKLKLEEGGEKFVWGFSTVGKKLLAVCERMY